MFIGYLTGIDGCSLKLYDRRQNFEICSKCISIPNYMILMVLFLNLNEVISLRIE